MGTRLISAYCDRLPWAVCSRPESACTCNHLSSIVIIIIILVIFIFNSNFNCVINSFKINLSVGGSFNHDHAIA